MLRDLTIKNYRCFKDFSIDGLGRVNLIVGKNNSGKTSFLEAVYLLVNQQNPFSLLELLYNRGEYGEVVDVRREFDYQIAHIFHGHEPDPRLEPRICLHSKSDTTIGAVMQLLPVKEFNNRSAVSPFRLRFKYGEVNDLSQERSLEEGIDLPLGFDHAFRSSFVPSAKQPGPHQFVAPRNIDFHYLAKLWDQIISVPSKEQRVVQGLKLVEPSVEDVRFTSQLTSSGVLINLRDRATRLPLSSLGDGMQRVLMLVMAAVNAENSTLFIDEIDTGLYFGVQADVWRLLIDTAQRLNIQIFATTHSWDCIVAFQEALAQTRNGQDDLGMLFRLQERKGDIVAVDYDADKLDVAVDHMIEVR